MIGKKPLAAAVVAALAIGGYAIAQSPAANMTSRIDRPNLVANSDGTSAAKIIPMVL